MFNSELKEQYINDSNFTEAREKFARHLFSAIEKTKNNGVLIYALAMWMKYNPLLTLLPGTKSKVGIRL